MLLITAWCAGLCTELRDGEAGVAVVVSGAWCCFALIRGTSCRANLHHVWFRGWGHCVCASAPWERRAALYLARVCAGLPKLEDFLISHFLH